MMFSVEIVLKSGGTLSFDNVTTCGLNAPFYYVNLGSGERLEINPEQLVYVKYGKGFAEFIDQCKQEQNTRG